jgi:hypothetical protein
VKQENRKDPAPIISTSQRAQVLNEELEEKEGRAFANPRGEAGRLRLKNEPGSG